MKLDGLRYKILLTLCWCCRCASVAQLTNSGASGEEVEAAVRWLTARRLTSRKTLPLANFRITGPLTTWDGACGHADFGSLAWEMERRWRMTPPEATFVVWATPRATRIVGGVSGRRRQPLQVQHDLGVAEVFRTRATGKSEHWLGEDAYRAYWQENRRSKVSDALILDSDQRISRVIEFGGRYSRRRLEEFHRFWANKRSTAYEIW